MQEKNSFSYKDIFSDGELYSLLAALFMLGFAYVFEHFANLYELAYSVRPTSNYVGDIILDNLPVINLNLVVVEGALLGIVIGTLYVLSKPRYVLFTLKSLALFIAIRALFISLTHIGIYPGTINPGTGIFDGVYTYLNFQSGFFFSGHAGMPFLMALIFWERPAARLTFLLISLVFGGAVLFGHIHYSIDVLAAPFMAYGIFGISKRLFPSDYALITAEPLK